MSYELESRPIQRWFKQHWKSLVQFRRASSKATRQYTEPTIGRRSRHQVSLQLQNQLIELFDGDRQRAEQFVADVRFGLAGKSEAYYWSLALQRKRYVSANSVTENLVQISRSPTKADPQLMFLERELSTNPINDEKKIKLYLEAASNLAKQRKFDLALPVLNRLIREHSDCLQGYLIRGKILRDLGKYDAALDDFEHIIQQQPHHMAAHRDKGLIEYDQRDYRSAIASLSIVIGHLPSGQLFKVRADAYKGLGQNEAAIADYQSAQTVYARQGAVYKVRQLEKQIQALAQMTDKRHPMSRNRVDFPFEQGRASDKQYLLQLLNGDQVKACRLLALTRSRHPSRSVHWYFEKTIYDLKRDRS